MGLRTEHFHVIESIFEGRGPEQSVRIMRRDKLEGVEIPIAEWRQILRWWLQLEEPETLMIGNDPR